MENFLIYGQKIAVFTNIRPHRHIQFYIILFFRKACVPLEAIQGIHFLQQTQRRLLCDIQRFADHLKDFAVGNVPVIFLVDKGGFPQLIVMGC